MILQKSDLPLKKRLLLTNAKNRFLLPILFVKRFSCQIKVSFELSIYKRILKCISISTSKKEAAKTVFNIDNTIHY